MLNRVIRIHRFMAEIRVFVLLNKSGDYACNKI